MKIVVPSSHKPWKFRKTQLLLTLHSVWMAECRRSPVRTPPPRHQELQEQPSTAQKQRKCRPTRSPTPTTTLHLRSPLTTLIETPQTLELFNGKMDIYMSWLVCGPWNRDFPFSQDTFKSSTLSNWHMSVCVTNASGSLQMQACPQLVSCWHKLV